MPDRVDSPVVGVFGGGQLARMMLEAASRLALDVRVLTPSASDPAAVVASAVTLGDPHDNATLRRFAESVDVLTFDHEPPDLAVLDGIDELCAIRPGRSVLEMTDKGAQRSRLAELGLAVPPFTVASSPAEVVEFAGEHGWPLVLKHTTGGYDGRGVQAVSDAAAAEAWMSLTPTATFVVEPLLDIQREVAVLVARRPGGERVVYPVVETVQRDGMCRAAFVPAGLDESLAHDALELACTIADATGSVGILAVELFCVDDRVVVNELAPRPHNSGHLTIEACVTSQFENHLRAVLDWPLGSVELRARAAAMHNVVGGDAPLDPRVALPRALTVSDAAVHLYGKASRPERKLGHVTSLGPDLDAARADARRAAHLLESHPPPDAETP